MPDLFEQGQARLRASRLVGTGGISVLAQYAIDTPGRYFGSSEEMTGFGILYTAVVVLLVVAGILAHLRHLRRAAEITPVLVSLNVGVFLPLVVADPVVAGTVILWNVVLLGNRLFPAEPASPSARGFPTPSERPAFWLTLNGPAVRHLSLASLIATTAVVGYRMAAQAGAQIVCLVLALVVVGWSWPFVVQLARQRRRGPFVAAAFLVAAALSVSSPSVALSFLAGYQAVVLVLIAVETPVFSDLVDYFYDKPAVLIVVSFVVLIAVGTLFLSFPVSASSSESIAPLDALFTATSAACVTGLVVLDTGSDFSPFGQFVILGLIQVGGLNIMVLSAFASLLLIGRGLGIRVEKALGEMLDLPQLGSASRIVKLIVVSTLLIEGAGAAYLAYVYSGEGYRLPDAIWNGIFHATSAFCNAGFGLRADSLIGFQRRPSVLLVMAALITLGGLGFAVLATVWSRWILGRRGILALHVRLVLATSGFLVLLGTIVYVAFEWQHSLVGLAPADRIVNALFQAATPRTAGFNSVDLRQIQPVTLLFLVVLMFIGASPGGTGGGIKTTTTAVLFGAISAIVRGEPRVVVFGHTLPMETIYRSAAIAVIAMLILLIGCAAILATHELPFEVVLFEVVSALGTVGLSLGATAHLNPIGKWVLIVIMLVGRVGPLTLALLLGREGRSKIGYPKARIMIG